MKYNMERYLQSMTFIFDEQLKFSSPPKGTYWKNPRHLLALSNLKDRDLGTLVFTFHKENEDNWVTGVKVYCKNEDLHSILQVGRYPVTSSKMVVLKPTQIIVSAKVDTSCLLYTSPSPRDATLSRMPSSA